MALQQFKAAGGPRILPDMLKVKRMNSGFVIIRVCWCGIEGGYKCHRIGRMPVPKKGNLHCCDNWWGIALFGKMLGRIVHNHLQKLTDMALPELQCELSRDSDMVFMVRKLMIQYNVLFLWTCIRPMTLFQEKHCGHLCKI